MVGNMTWGYSWLEFFLAGSVTAITAYVSTGWVVKNARKWKIIDDPTVHKLPKVVHTTPVPRGGGLAIGIATLVAMGLFLPWNLQTAGIVGGVVILMFTGWWDDRNEEKISPFARLGLNLAAALLIVAAGTEIKFISNPAGGVINFAAWKGCLGPVCVNWVAAIVAVGWLVWMQNIVGWSSGVDGQLPGFVITAAVATAALAMRFKGDSSQAPVIILAGITAGAYTGFLPWNWWPQKIMPGYGGKSLAGFLLGTAAILSSAKVGTMLMVLGIPMVDAIMVIVKRIREGRLPVWGGREHLHHYLLDLGWSKQNIALFYWGMSAIFAIVAWRLQAPAKFFTMAGIGLILAGIILWLQLWSTSLKPPDQGSGLKT